MLWKNVFQHGGNRFAEISKSYYDLDFSMFQPIFPAEIRNLLWTFQESVQNVAFFHSLPLVFQ